jgi:hypothetical protein
MLPGLNLADAFKNIEPEEREALDTFIRLGEFTTRTLQMLTGESPEPVVRPQPIPEARPKPSIFISYRRDDSGDMAGRICDRLAQHFGVFRDIESIPLGVDFRQFIATAVEKCSGMLIIIGKEWASARDSAGYRRLDQANDLTRIEIEVALARAIPVIPILVHGAEMPRPQELPMTLRDLCFRQGRPIRSECFHQDMDFLVRELERAIPATVG